MAFYTSSIKTNYYEPNVFASKNRVEYRLDSDKMFLSNMRLLNVGNGSNNGANQANRGCGALRFVKTIELLDGSKSLCRLDNAGSVFTFMKVNNTNEANIGQHLLDKANLGYFFTNASLTVATPTISPIATRFDVNNTNLAYIDLSTLLPFLKASQVVPSMIFKSLKLVLTFADDTAGLNINWLGAFSPLLAVDEMLNTDVSMAMLKNYKGFTWNEIENDQYQIPEIEQNSLANKEVLVQRVNNQLKGFDNKMVKRCFIQKIVRNTTHYEDFGSQGSAPLLRERLQVRKNGGNLYPGNGLDSPALIQNEVVQIWGEMNKSTLTPYLGTLISENILGDFYLAFDLTGSRTNELQIEYQRTVIKDKSAGHPDRTSYGISMNVYAEVEKVLQVNGDGSYRVMYV